MNFCGWGSSSQCYKPIQLQPTFPPFQTMPTEYPSTNQKVSVKGANYQIKAHFHYEQPAPNLDALNQTQRTHEGIIITKNGPTWTHTKKRKNSIIEQVWEENEKDKSRIGQQNTSQFRHASMFRSTHDRERLKSEECQLRSQLGETNSYAQLVKENQQLRRVIMEQFIPLKRLYEKLKREQEDRQYLVSQLEWKVKQLAREVKNRKF